MLTAKKGYLCGKPISYCESVNRTHACGLLLDIKRACCIIDYSMPTLLIQDTIRKPSIMPQEDLAAITNFIKHECAFFGNFRYL